MHYGQAPPSSQPRRGGREPGRRASRQVGGRGCQAPTCSGVPQGARVPRSNLFGRAPSRRSTRHVRPFPDQREDTPKLRLSVAPQAHRGPFHMMPAGFSRGGAAGSAQTLAPPRQARWGPKPARAVARPAIVICRRQGRPGRAGPMRRAEGVAGCGSAGASPSHARRQRAPHRPCVGGGEVCALRAGPPPPPSPDGAEESLGAAPAAKWAGAGARPRLARAYLRGRGCHAQTCLGVPPRGRAPATCRRFLVREDTPKLRLSVAPQAHRGPFHMMPAGFSSAGAAGSAQTLAPPRRARWGPKCARGGPPHPCDARAREPRTEPWAMPPRAPHRPCVGGGKVCALRVAPPILPAQPRSGRKRWSTRHVPPFPGQREDTPKLRLSVAPQAHRGPFHMMLAGFSREGAAGSAQTLAPPRQARWGPKCARALARPRHCDARAREPRTNP